MGDDACWGTYRGCPIMELAIGFPVTSDPIRAAFGPC